MASLDKARERIAYHLEKIETGRIRLRTIQIGIDLEVKCPGLRMTAKAPKCSTILRREFGLSGRPEKLREIYGRLLADAGVTPENGRIPTV